MTTATLLLLAGLGAGLVGVTEGADHTRTTTVATAVSPLTPTAPGVAGAPAAAGPGAVTVAGEFCVLCWN